ncbi:hypothetical protein E6W17_30545 [Streptomyces sp. A1547]|nr:hypothetical protein E6W17_30545 [Streptomyces sp. A1547]
MFPILLAGKETRPYSPVARDEVPPEFCRARYKWGDCLTLRGPIDYRGRCGARRRAELLADKAPEPLLERAGQAATVARANRTPLLVVAGAVIVALVLVRRSRGRRR